MKPRPLQMTVPAPVDSGLLPRLRTLLQRRQKPRQTSGNMATLSAYRAAIAWLNEGLLITDARGHITEANPAAAHLLNRSISALTGLPLVQVIPPPSTDTPPQPHQITVRNGQEERLIALRYLPLARHGDHTGPQIILLQEITADRHTARAPQDSEEGAQIAGRLKDEFLATISHELGTPLNHIIGYVDLILMGTYGPLTADQREHLGQVSENAHRLAELCTAIIDLSRLQVGDLRLEMEPVAPLPLLQDCLQRITPLAHNHGLQVYSYLPTSLPDLHADSRRLHQIMDALLDNAVRFTPQGWLALHAGLVTRQQALDFPVDLPELPALHYCLLAVQDSGIGIAAQDQVAIFERFRQVDGSYARRYPGAGIGLALAYRLTRLMNGRLWVESVPRQGATFYVLLPVPLADACPAQPDLA